MDIAFLIGLIIIGGLSIGWILHHRSSHHMTPILKRLAAEKNGTVESSNPLRMPKLRFSYYGTEVEVSNASTGISGESTRYTYAVFAAKDSKSFEFRILPRSLQTIGDKWVGLKKNMPIGLDKLDKRLAIYTNNETLMKAVLSDHIQTDLLTWSEQKTDNQINDIRIYDNNLIFAVTGSLKNYEDYKFLIDTACRFYDAVINVISNCSIASNGH